MLIDAGALRYSIYLCHVVERESTSETSQGEMEAIWTLFECIEPTNTWCQKRWLEGQRH